MNTLLLRTEGNTSYIAVSDGNKIIVAEEWESGRELARDLLGCIVRLLSSTHLVLADIGAIACYAGPGSFTSLRIGLATANTLAYSYDIPIVSSGGEAWARLCLEKIVRGEDERIVVPYYGSEPHITIQKK